MMKSATLLSLSLAALVGCGGDDPKKPPIMVMPDAPMNDPTPDAPEQAACTAPSAIPGGDAGAMLPIEYTADGDMMTAGNQEYWISGIALNEDMRPDALFIVLAEGPPPSYTHANFPSPTPQNPFVTDLSGADGDATKCSVCLNLVTDVNTANMMELEYVHDYMPRQGTVTLTALSPQKVTGSITGVTYEHVNIDYMAGTQTVDPSGCTATMGDLTFDTVPTMGKTADGRRTYGVKIPLNGGMVKKAQFAQ